MKTRFFTRALSVLVVAGISLAGIAAIRLGAALPEATGSAPQDQNAIAPIGGNYSGLVTLKFTLGGVYSTTLSTPTPPPAGTPAPADVGEIDLALFLSQTGSAVSGYVNLERSLAFTAEHTIQATPVVIAPLSTAQPTLAPVALKIGPYVQGTFDGSTLTVQSEKTTQVVAGIPMQRQFRIVGTLKPGDPNTLIGEYRETVWGYGPQPLTVLGQFEVSRPFVSSNGLSNVNIAPVTAPDGAVVMRGRSVTVNVLTNDSDANGDALTVTSVSIPLRGTASTNGSSVTYSAPADFSGQVVLNYFVSDGKGGTAAGTLSVQVSGPVYLPLVRR